MSSTGLQNALELGAVEDPDTVCETKFIVGPDLATILSSPDPFLCSLRHRLRAAGRADTADVEQTEKMIPFLTREITFGQNVSKLVSGVDMLDLDQRVKIDPVKQPIKRNSVYSEYVSHCRTSAFDHLE